MAYLGKSFCWNRRWSDVHKTVVWNSQISRNFGRLGILFADDDFASKYSRAAFLEISTFWTHLLLNVDQTINDCLEIFATFFFCVFQIRYWIWMAMWSGCMQASGVSEILGLTLFITDPTRDEAASTSGRDVCRSAWRAFGEPRIHGWSYFFGKERTDLLDHTTICDNHKDPCRTCENLSVEKSKQRYELTQMWI